MKKTALLLLLKNKEGPGSHYKGYIASRININMNKRESINTTSFMALNTSSQERLY
jgi:hypothetical protein